MDACPDVLPIGMGKNFAIPRSTSEIFDLNSNKIEHFSKVSVAKDRLGYNAEWRFM
jgi:hypothetical protein